MLYYMVACEALWGRLLTCGRLLIGRGPRKWDENFGMFRGAGLPIPRRLTTCPTKRQSRNQNFRQPATILCWCTTWVWLILSVQVCYGVDFQKDVKPILSNHCYQCHGPDAPNRKAGLRLDTKAGVLSTIVPGDPSASLMMKRAANPKVALRMPPPYAHKDLTPENVKTLEQWIASGAEWKEHWAFIAPERPAVPPVSRPEWVRNPLAYRGLDQKLTGVEKARVVKEILV